MKKLATVIMTIVIILIIAILCIFGNIIWKEIVSLKEAREPENFQTVFSEETSNNKNTEKTENSTNNLFSEIEDPNQNLNYNQVNVDKYFYNQLEEQSKTIYRAMEINKENMKTGTYVVNFGNEFYSVLEQENGQEKLGYYYQSAIEAYTYDNPDVFYLNPNKMYLNIETTTSIRGNTYNVYISNKNEDNYLIDEFSSKAQVDLAIQEIEKKKNEILSKRSKDTLDNIKMVHDYLVDNISYDESISRPHIYNIYGALVNNVAVCEGYARSFKYLMDALEIPCVVVIGEATNSNGETENHAWNYVQLDSRWYAIDATWDDPVIVGGGSLNNASKYKYFLKDGSTFSKDHIPSGQFTPDGKIFEYPSLN